MGRLIQMAAAAAAMTMAACGAPMGAIDAGAMADGPTDHTAAYLGGYNGTLASDVDESHLSPAPFNAVASITQSGNTITVTFSSITDRDPMFPAPNRPISCPVSFALGMAVAAPYEAMEGSGAAMPATCAWRGLQCTLNSGQIWPRLDGVTRIDLDWSCNDPHYPIVLERYEGMPTGR